VADFSHIQKYSPEQLRLMGVSLKNGDDVKNWLKNYRFSDKGLWLPNLKPI